MLTAAAIPPHPAPLHAGDMETVPVALPGDTPLSFSYSFSFDMEEDDGE